MVERLGVAHGGDLLKRADAQLRISVALQARDDEWPAQLAGRVEVQHRLRTAPVVRRNTSAREHRPSMLLLPRQMLDSDPPELALEDLCPPLGIRRHRQHAALDAQTAAAATTHRADD